MEVAGMTGWKWVRIPEVLHARLTAAHDAIESERVQRERARTGVRYYEIVEMALNALEREREHGVDVDRGGPGRGPGDTGRRDMDRLDTTGRT